MVLKNTNASPFHGKEWSGVVFDMSDIQIARNYVNKSERLDEEQKKRLKLLLSSGKIVPGAVIDSTYEELLEVIDDNASNTNYTGILISI